MELCFEKAVPGGSIAVGRGRVFCFFLFASHQAKAIRVMRRIASCNSFLIWREVEVWNVMVDVLWVCKMRGELVAVVQDYSSRSTFPSPASFQRSPLSSV